MSLSEKQALTELLKVYRRSPCLWDRNHLLYSNKDARSKAYDVLVQKYKSYQDDANKDSVKRKIDNMRYAYKREVKKILAARAKGIYGRRPSLWYFDLLTFIDSDIQYEGGTSSDVLSLATDEDNEEAHNELENVKEEYSAEEIEIEAPEYTPEAFLEDTKEESLLKKYLQKTHEINESNTSTSNCDNQDSIHNTHKDLSEPDVLNNESLIFGRMVGLQLQELDSFQRVMAQKLISDTIFYARLNKLTTGSFINLKEMFQKCMEAGPAP